MLQMSFLTLAKLERHDASVDGLADAPFIHSFIHWFARSSTIETLSIHHDAAAGWRHRERTQSGEKKMTRPMAGQPASQRASSSMPNTVRNSSERLTGMPLIPPGYDIDFDDDDHSGPGPDFSSSLLGSHLVFPHFTKKERFLRSGSSWIRDPGSASSVEEEGWVAESAILSIAAKISFFSPILASSILAAGRPNPGELRDPPSWYDCLLIRTGWLHGWRCTRRARPCHVTHQLFLLAVLVLIVSESSS